MAEGLRALCFFFYHRYAFGSEGKAEFKIGPNKDVEYEVTLKDFQRVGSALSMVPFWFVFKPPKEEIHLHLTN